MTCPTGHIARGGFVLQGNNRLARLWHTCSLSRPVSSRALSPVASQDSAHRFQADSHLDCIFAHSRPRPTKWGCRLTTSCQATASSPHTATVQAAEKKQSKKQGGPVTLPTTDESAELDKIRHSVSIDLSVAYIARTRFAMHVALR